MCVCMAYAWRWRMVCYGVCMALGRRMHGVGYAYIWRWVYGVQALGVACVWCTLCVSFYDVT